MHRAIAVTVAFVALFAFFGPRASAQDDAQPASGDVAIGTVDTYSWEPLTGACYIINGGSNEGCDENGDGWVTFEGVPVGTYTVTMTRVPEGYQGAADFEVGVDDSGYTPHPYVELEPLAGPPDPGYVTVSITAFDVISGADIGGACYRIIELGMEGCDDDSDGIVWFHDVAPGTYPTEITRIPDGYVANGDYIIEVTGDARFGTNARFGFLPESSDPDGGTINVSIKSIDAAGGSTIGTGPGGVPGACYIINGASNEGCDENSDGSVTFQDVPVGTYTLTMTKAPDGYQKVADREVTIGPAGGTWQTLQIEVTRVAAAPAAPSNPPASAPAPPVTTLPNTGAGGVAATSNAWLSLILLGGGIGSLALGAATRRIFA